VRYYSITISNPDTGQSLVPSGQGFAFGTGPTFSTLYRDALTGRMMTNPGALNIEFDIPVTRLATPQGGFRIKIHGVGLRMIGQAANLAGMNFSMKAGMAPGLPLANPAQAGLIVQGNILQGYGNWQGTDQTLDLIVNAGVKQSIFDIPVPFWWPAGTSLDDAIDNALAQSFPGFKTQIHIDANLKLANDEAGYYDNFAQFASYLNGITLMIGSQYRTNYGGVNIVTNGDVISVFDGTDTSSGPSAVNVPIAFTDLIGQPTWIGGTQINFQTVLRADVEVGNLITFPTGIVPPYALTASSVVAPGANVPVNSKSVFQGKFMVNELHHFGNFRDSDADAWCTVFNVAAPPPPGSPLS
jgi:hypothetical protein